MPAVPSSAQQRCFAHEEALTAARAAGGRGRSTAARTAKGLPPELRDVQKRLLELLDKVEAGHVPAAAATAIAALAARLLDLSKFAVELHDQRELAARLDQLEGRLRPGEHA
ncbi:MAG TPA: hypothetical protein VFA70_08145 [Dehalococcoidia bacterium]|nr:hypothetical protein [Dehalococcoidia bacterium]